MWFAGWPKWFSPPMYAQMPIGASQAVWTLEAQP